MERTENKTKTLTAMLKNQVEVDFHCPSCDGTRLYEMQSKGHRVRVFSDGSLRVDPEDAIEPEWEHYCCGDCGYVVCDDVHSGRGSVVTDPYELLDWLFEACLDYVRQEGYPVNQFPVTE